MENIVNVECNDLNLFLDKEKRISANFICYDHVSQSMTSITTSINNQINEIYVNTEINGDFVKRLEYKLKLTMKLHLAKLTFINREEKFLLQTSLRDIYEPVTLTQGGVRIGDNPLVIDGKILKFFSYKTKFFLECLVKEIDLESNDFAQKAIMIKINDDVNNLYNNTKVKDKFKEMLKKRSMNKRIFLDALSVCLEGKVIEIEYDEHKGYTLWTTLEDLVGVYDCN